ncbi:GSCOCG00011055001-RA-CDS [Cotesia congregata]|uniref:Uncharacterized protein n=2 Tax=Cotesia TaxID=32390 RepID=A0A8J2EFE4_COTCN|nr:uncharacterized protein LOC123270917 [Cotesia glomerata]KAH0552455.1 hypothetical protein KQX54_010282 [Cotesia glomerata]CAD6212787.1 GSCOCG00011055001-RA-CDS [Cotesia congregata]CAG5073505.1 Protein of unknown function [Cotesia congregata]
MVFREFNRLAGKLQASAKLQPLFPLRPTPLNKADAPKMIYDTVKTKPVSVDRAATASYSTIPPKLEAKMKKFQKDTSKPVFLMGGTPDKILFGITCVLTVFGLGKSAQFYWPYIWTK